MIITILCAALGLGGFLYATFTFYRLRAEARRAGLPVSVFTNTEDPWPQLDKMISTAPPDRRIRNTGTSPPPLPRTVAPARGPRLWLPVLLGAVGVLGSLAYFGYDFYQLHHFPPGYRNRPASGWGVRPGEDEFERADALIDPAGGTNAFGNTPEAVALAHAFAEAVTGVRERSFTKGFKFDWLEPQQQGRFRVYCELHREECAFLVHVPGLRRFDEDFTEKVDARRALAQLAWLTAQTVMKDRQTGRPEMELAVGLRGVSQYSPIMLGYYRENPSGPEDGIVKYIDDTTQRHYLWAFFAPAAPVRGARGIGH